MNTPGHAQVRKAPDPRFAIVLTVMFLLASAFAISHHHMWRDELQAWLIARDSTSLFDLCRNMKYEGHPPLWHICLMPLTRLTTSPVAMQVFHLSIAAATIYLVARYSPFSNIQNIFFSFGYFTFYEYSIISRNYAIGLLLIIVFCVLYPRRYTTFPLVGIVFFLLAHTSVHALILVIVMAFSLSCDYLYLRKQIVQTTKINERAIWIGFCLTGLGIITSILQIAPPADSGFAVRWHLNFDASRLAGVLGTVTNAFLPIPEAGINYWYSRWIGEQPVWVMFLALATILLALICFVLVLTRRPTALLMFLGCTFGLLVFFYVKHSGHIRHHGFVFIVFIMIVWIYRFCDEVKLPADINYYSERLERPLSYMLTLILFVHLIGGMIAVYMDSKYVFSHAKRAAEYITDNGLTNMLMVGEKDTAATAVVGYLDKDRIYYPRGQRFGSFIIWDKSRLEKVSDRTVIEQAEALGEQHGENVLIIMNRQMDKAAVEGCPIMHLAHFSGSAVHTENFYLYILEGGN